MNSPYLYNPNPITEEERQKKFDALVKKIEADRLENQVAEQVGADAHDHDIDFLEECAREDRNEQLYETQSYQLASGDYS